MPRIQPKARSTSLRKSSKNQQGFAYTVRTRSGVWFLVRLEKRSDLGMGVRQGRPGGPKESSGRGGRRRELAVHVLDPVDERGEQPIGLAHGLDVGQPLEQLAEHHGD